MKLKPLSLLFLSATVSLPELAIAQNRSALEEIIVTAQKREETLQDVPIAISALSADALEKQGIGNLNDFQKGQVPSLKVVQFAGRANSLQFGIRGITEADPAQLTVERPIAVYVDGVYISRGNGMDTEVFDIERMEILRGPQGTLFGRNAEGGAVNITTRKPKGEFGFKQELEASDLDEYKSRTLVDTPTWNGLSASLAYVYHGANGWITNPADNRDFNWQKKNAYRAAVEYKADDVLVDYSYDHSNVDYMQNYNVLNSKPTISLNPRPVGSGRPERAWTGTLVPVQNTENDGHNLTVEWNATQQLTFKSITGYRNLKDNNAATGSGANIFLPLPYALRGGFTDPNVTQIALSDAQSKAITHANQLSQEFQLVGDFDRLEWQAGALYFHEDGSFVGWTDFGYRYFCPGASFVFPGGVPVPAPGSYGANCGTPQLLPTSMRPSGDTLTNVSTDSYGLFAQATWNPDILEDRLKITLGLRYGKDEKDINRPREAGVSLATPTKATAKSERVDPAVTIAYRLLDDTSIYARYGTAYRGGGVSVREIQTFTPYSEEEVATTELGVKSVFWDNRARVNAAAFYNEIDGFLVFPQQTNCVPQSACGTANTVGLNSSDTVRTHGFEMDSSLLLVDGLTLSLQYSYLDADVPTFTVNGVALKFPLNNAARNAWSVGLDYAFEPFAFGTLSAHVDASRSDAYCFNPNSCSPNAARQMPAVRGGDVTLVNARLTLADIPVGAGTLASTLWAKNLTDEEYVNFGYPSPNNGLVSDNTVTQYGEPRSIGVTLTYQY